MIEFEFPILVAFVM